MGGFLLLKSCRNCDVDKVDMIKTEYRKLKVWYLKQLLS